MTSPQPDQLTLLTEIRDLLIEIRDQRKPAERVMPTATARPTSSPPKVDHTGPRDTIG